MSTFVVVNRVTSHYLACVLADIFVSKIALWHSIVLLVQLLSVLGVTVLIVPQLSPDSLIVDVCTVTIVSKFYYHSSIKRT